MNSAKPASLSATQWARRPEEAPLATAPAAGLAEHDEAAVHWVDVELKYRGYIARERRSAARLAALESMELPAGMVFGSIDGISREAREKLEQVRPRTLGQAAMVPGVTAADLHRVAHAVARGVVSRETGVEVVGSSGARNREDYSRGVPERK